MKHLDFLIKPASSLCNLRCRYCFYADEAANRTRESMGFMKQETVDMLLENAFAAIDPNGTISFSFQGGEPTLAGLDFFRDFVKKAKAKKPINTGLTFAIQTNGILLNNEWAEFLQEADFLVGLSIDGYKDAHNFCRIAGDGKQTWNRVVRTAELLERHKIRRNALCVVTGQVARSPKKTYETLKKMGFEYLQFIACMEPLDRPDEIRPWSLRAEDYGRFLCQMFDLWYRDWECGSYCSIRLFDDYVHSVMGLPGSTCASCGRCGEYLVVEGDGSVYPCDFYVLDEWKLGSLEDMSVMDLIKTPEALRFLEWGKDKPAGCRQCPWFSVCGGGCKRDWIQGPDGAENKFCAAFQMFFQHAWDRLRMIANAEQFMRTRYEQ